MINLSVIIPAYNAENTLPSLLDEILRESSLEIEVIVVDDGSTDKTRELAESYAKADSRVSVISQENSFAGVARNRGFDASGGEYVAFIDADDIILPGALAMMYKRAVSERADILKAGFAYHDLSNAESYRTLYSMNSAVDGIRRIGVTSFAKLPRRLLHIPDMPWNAVYRSEFLRENRIRFNSLRCVNDHSFYIWCLIKAERVKIIGEPVAIYRIGQSESLIGIKPHHFECQVASFSIVKDIVKDIPEDQKRIVMQHELTAVFDWYARCEREGSLTPEMTRVMSDFVLGVDENDVGEEFVKSFHYSKSYYQMKYNTPAPKRPNKLIRAISCWQEHGLRYTLAKLFGNENKHYKFNPTAPEGR